MRKKKGFQNRTRRASYSFIKTCSGDYMPRSCIKNNRNRRSSSNCMIESVLHLLWKELCSQSNAKAKQDACDMFSL